MEQVRKASLESLLDFTNSLKAAHSFQFYLYTVDWTKFLLENE